MMSKYIKYSDDSYMIREVFDHNWCQSMINLAEAKGFEEAPITTANGFVMAKDIRNNTRVIIDDPLLADEIWLKVKDWAIPNFNNKKVIGLNERFRFYRYDPGQTFKWHYDGYYERDNGERSQFTFMIYLNDNFEGGTTKFRRFKVLPETGAVLFFYHHQLHTGNIVTFGRKYVLRTDVMYTKL